MNRNSNLIRIFCAVSLSALIISSCSVGFVSSTPTEPPPATPTATPVPPKKLVICSSMEPQSLYLYGSSARGNWNILEAIYDGPIDRTNFTSQPVILEGLPTLENGNASLKPVAVKTGDTVIDISGDPIILQKGSRVFPSGCSSIECAIEWDGISELKVDQLSATFKLKAGILWSDGTPLKAEDSVFSYQVAEDKSTPVYKDVIDRSTSYIALDDQTVQWTGKPGYFPSDFNDLFWNPLPKHILGSIAPADLLTSDLSARQPIGWGPYKIEEWKAGEYIRLVKNPNYFRAAEGLPKFDILEYRFIGKEADSALQALESGTCDIVDQTVNLQDQMQDLRQMELDKKLVTFTALGPDWEHLDFGIKPVAYDDGYNPYGDERPSFFGDPRVRQAFAYCMDREGAIKQFLKAKTSVPLSYLPPNHPFYATGLPEYAYDPAKGMELLDQSGWKDFDNDPTTPRVAATVNDVPAGTVFEVSFAFPDSLLRQKMAAFYQASLAKCGIKVDLTPKSVDDFYAPGPDGMIFGRQFDLAQFSWAAGQQPPCFLYESAEIPTRENGWVGKRSGGVNITGYSNSQYDAACEAARQSGGNSSINQQNQVQIQQILAVDLPSIPMYYGVKIAAARPGICGVKLDISSRSDFPNLEELDSALDCKK